MQHHTPFFMIITLTINYYYFNYTVMNKLKLFSVYNVYFSVYLRHSIFHSDLYLKHK